MAEQNTGDVTQLLAAAAGGDRAAVGQIYAILYPQLKAMAHRRVRYEAAGAVLDTTALVHESYLRLVKGDNLSLENRRHFMSYAARVMRSVVVDVLRQGSTRRLLMAGKKLTSCVAGALLAFASVGVNGQRLGQQRK